MQYFWVHRVIKYIVLKFKMKFPAYLVTLNFFMELPAFWHSHGYFFKYPCETFLKTSHTPHIAAALTTLPLSGGPVPQDSSGPSNQKRVKEHNKQFEVFTWLPNSPDADLMGSDRIHEKLTQSTKISPHIPHGTKDLLLISQYQSLKDTLRYCLTTAWLVRSLLAGKGNYQI